MAVIPSGQIQNETALEWFTRLNNSSVVFRTGHELFDVYRCIVAGAITEIVGKEATGKLQLSMTIISDILLSLEKYNYIVIVIDFNGSFRTDRLVEILSNKRPQLDFKTEELLERIYYSQTKTHEEFEARLSELKNLLQDCHFIPFLFVNKIDAILYDALDKKILDGTVQRRVLSTFRELSATQGLTILTLNHLVNWRGHSTSALGKSWRNGIPCRITLTREGIDREHFAQIENRKIQSEKLRFLLTKSGFESYPYPKPDKSPL